METGQVRERVRSAAAIPTRGCCSRPSRRGAPAAAAADAPTLIAGRGRAACISRSAAACCGARSGQVRAVDGVDARGARRARRSGWWAKAAPARSTHGLRACCGWCRRQGCIRFEGQDLAAAAPSGSCARLRADMQIVFQDPFGSLSPRMTVAEIVGRGAARARAAACRAAQRARPGRRGAGRGRAAGECAATATRTSSAAASASASPSRGPWC